MSIPEETAVKGIPWILETLQVLRIDEDRERGGRSIPPPRRGGWYSRDRILGAQR